MSRDAVLGLDAGTSSAKAVVVDADGGILATGNSGSIPTAVPEPGAAEQDPEQIIAALDDAAGAAIAASPLDVRIVAVAVAAQSGSVVPIGDDDRPVSNLLTWLDARSAPVVEAWDDSTRKMIRSVSGWSATAGTGLASVCWMRSRHPDRLERARRWASVDDHVAHRLTGRWRTNPSNAAGMQLMDVSRRDWDDRLCALAGISAGQLASIHRTGDELGRIGAGTAASLGGVTEAPLMVGGHDQACTALALGASEPGVVVVSVGTAWVLTAVTGPVPVEELPHDLNLSPHVVDGRWSASQNLGGLGEMLSWWRRRVHGRDSPPQQIDRDLIDATGDGPIFVPLLDPRESAEWGALHGAGSDATDAEVIHAVVEAAAFEIRRSIEQIVATVAPVDRLILVGGSARSRPLLQLVANVTGRPVSTPDDASWPALGAAAVCAGSIDWPLPDHVSGAATVTEPATDPRAHHDDRYGAYLRLVEGDSP